MISKKGLGIIIAIVGIAIIIPISYFILVDALQPLIDPTAEHKTLDFGIIFGDFLYAILFIILVMVIAGLIVILLKKGG